jgi:hypothetical protein
MTDNVGRERLGRQSAAHGSACRERAANAPIPKRGRGRKGRGSSSQAQSEPEYKRQHVDEIEAEYDVEHGEDDANISPPPPTPRVRKRRVRNKQPQPPPVDEVFGGGPTDLSVIPTYGKHIAARLWKGEVSYFNNYLYFAICFLNFINLFYYYFPVQLEDFKVYE